VGPRTAGAVYVHPLVIPGWNAELLVHADTRVAILARGQVVAGMDWTTRSSPCSRADLSRWVRNVVYVCSLSRGARGR